MISRTEAGQLKIRIPEEIRKTFGAVCRDRDQTASQVLRTFIRDYIRKYGQQDMWGGK